MKRRVDRDAKGYVEKDGVTVPDLNSEPWVVPLILLKVIASDDTEVDDLRYSWELEAFDKT